MLKRLAVHNSFNGHNKVRSLSLKKDDRIVYKLWGTNERGIERIKIGNTPNNKYVSVTSKKNKL